jgi:large repetitive protein
MLRSLHSFVPFVVIVAACAPVEVPPEGDVDAGGDGDGGSSPDAGIDAPEGPPDVTPPDTMIASGPAAVARDAMATFGLASNEAFVTFRCSIDDAVAVECPSTFTTTPLADGSHRLSVVAVDAAGNVDPSPAEQTWMIDTVAPVVAITGGPLEGDRLNDTTPTFTFTVSGATAITCSIDAGAPAACVGSFTTSALTNGTHTVAISATDAAGNVTSASRGFTIDTLAPVVNVTARPPTTPTQATSATVSWSTTESATYTCRLDGGVVVACGSGTSGSRAQSGLADGSHSLVITATDAANNAGTATVTWTVDTTRPTLRFTTTPPSFYSTTITFDLGSTEVTTFTCTVRNDDTGALVDGPRACGTGTTGTITYGSIAPIGQFLDLTVTGVDAAGNTATNSLLRLFCRGTSTSCTIQ